MLEHSSLENSLPEIGSIKILVHWGNLPNIISKYLMTITNIQFRGLDLHPAVPEPEGGDHSAPPALSFAHPWRGVRTLAAEMHISLP